MTLYALHGFLGSGKDWEFLPSSLPGVRSVVPVELPGAFPGITMGEWAAAFNRNLREENVPLGSNYLIGYSLGGRLALHLLLDDPALWKGAVIVSAHPGLSEASEREGRLASDRKWAERIRGEAWEKWIGDWNARPVFRHDRPMESAPLSPQRREEMAAMLLRWSLGTQADLAGPLQSADVPLLWVVGADDASYVRQSEQLRFSHPASRAVVIKGAGHRVPWGAQKQFLDTIIQFMSHLEERQ